MGALARIVTVVATGLALSGCNTGAPGVFPHSPVPPPPSLSGAVSERPAASARPVSVATRRTLEAPPQVQETQPAVQPVMTGNGVGAGFRF